MHRYGVPVSRWSFRLCATSQLLIFVQPALLPVLPILAGWSDWWALASGDDRHLVGTPELGQWARAGQADLRGRSWARRTPRWHRV